VQNILKYRPKYLNFKYSKDLGKLKTPRLVWTSNYTVSLKINKKYPIPDIKGLFKTTGQNKSKANTNGIRPKANFDFKRVFNTKHIMKIYKH